MPFTEPWEAPNDDEVTLMATTNVEPETDFSARTEAKGGDTFQRGSDTVSKDGHLAWDFDFSGNEEGQTFKLIIEAENKQSWKYDGVIVNTDG